MWFKEEKYAWFIVSFLWIFGFLGSLGRIIVQYYQGPITDDLETSRAFLGYAWSASIFIGSLCAPFGGWLTDRFGYKTTMIAGSLLGVLSGAVIVLYPSPVGYMFGFGVLGGLAGIGTTTSYVMVNQWFKHHKAKALMIIGSSSSIGLALLTPLLVSNDSVITWTVAYRISIAVGVFFTLLTYFIIKEKKQQHSDPEVQTGTEAESEAEAAQPIIRKSKWTANRDFLITLRSPVIIVVIFALFTCGFSMGTVEMHLMAIQQTAHVSHAMFIASLSILGVLELVGGFVFAALLDRMPRAVALSCLYLIRTVAFILLFSHFYWSPVLFTLIFGATYLGAIPGGILLASESLSTKSVGLQAGILLFFHQLGGVFASVAGGLNYDWFQNYQLLIGVNIALSLVSGIGYYGVHRMLARKKAMEPVPGAEFIG
ncbi:MFS family permease [Paenibacillus phyllosphaerae]|uniref:MFS family permease n=1 Tax=Paenibacillus phyllosphaerae TaxID=274593 RepID=A0A7W5FR92_9BACL|nr:MFS transporter [Paenibacillus phyllosphaerae]MBB3114042.1 MFS family permease [Paenibacillus phyllosphaerae]